MTHWHPYFNIFNNKLPTNIYKGKYLIVTRDDSTVDIFRKSGDSDIYFSSSGKSISSSYSGAILLCDGQRQMWHPLGSDVRRP